MTAATSLAATQFPFKDSANNAQIGVTPPVDIGGLLQIAAPPGVHPVATPTATALVYSSGKCIGAPQSLANVVRSAGLSSTIATATLRSLSVISGEVDAVIFRGSPTVTTGLADNVNFSVAGADVALIADVLPFTVFSALGTGVISKLRAWGSYFGLAAGTTAYVQLVARSSITLANASDLSVSLGLVQD